MGRDPGSFSTMLRHALAAFLLAVGTTAGNGAGAWLDPKHQSDESPLAGMRFVAESPPHHLTLVGTDDGKTWYTLKGTCSGPSMTKIMFDFSPKGGPKDLTGTYSANRKAQYTTITWPDGNKWTMLDPAVTNLANAMGASTKH